MAKLVNLWDIHCAECTADDPCILCSEQIAAEHAYIAEHGDYIAERTTGEADFVTQWNPWGIHCAECDEPDLLCGPCSDQVWAERKRGATKVERTTGHSKRCSHVWFSFLRPADPDWCSGDGISIVCTKCDARTSAGPEHAASVLRSDAQRAHLIRAAIVQALTGTLYR